MIHAHRGRRKTIYSLSQVVVVYLYLATACSNIPTAIPRITTIPTFTPFQPLAAGTLDPFIPEQTVVSVTEAASANSTQVPLLPETTPNVLTVALESLSPVASFTLWVEPRLPIALQEKVNLPLDFRMVDSREEAMLHLEIGTDRLVSQWVYALVAPFPTIMDEVSFEMLRQVWYGTLGKTIQPLLMSEDTLATLTILWGNPVPEAVKVLAASDLLVYAWDHQPAWAVVPFEALEPRWKVLAVDGVSPVHKTFDAANYALTVPISLTGDLNLADVVHAVYGVSFIPAGNRDPSRLTVLAMTGVTALVRSTAYAMEQKGILYPAIDVGELLSATDITHISNEVPFVEDCPFPDPFQPGMRFCSDVRYIALMESIGTDIVELTGDHFQDWGTAAMDYTLQLYKDRSWLYFGGGADLDEARRAVTLEHNGNRLAFIGCNAKGGSFAQASTSSPGAAACDNEWMQAELKRLREEGYLPIATFQHNEYYSYEAEADQLRDFRAMARAGAVIVSGSQAHQPQALEFLENTLIHYGLGNLFFDQYEVSLPTRQAFIDRHIFYAGRHISTELLTIMFIDYARPRLMSLRERQELLETVFKASGW